MTRSLLVLADRLAELGVTRVVMEATSDYWRAPFYVLEAAGFETWLVNAKDVKHLPGRPKTDVLDAVWLCKVAERQMLRPSFVPPQNIRELRDLTRYRIDQIGVRTAEKQRVEKLLEDAGIKLSVVASDIFGVSGREMLAALIAGQRDPVVLADMARGRMRVKRPQLVEALTGRFTDHHGYLLAKMLARIDAIDADIADLDTQIEAQLSPFAGRWPALVEIPGVKATTAAVIIAEIGVDMTRFPTAAHLAGWAKFAPGIKESAGRKKGTGATGHGNRYLARALGEAAVQRRSDRHLPRRALPAHRPPTRQEEGHRRGRTLHPGHHLAPALRTRDPLPRPRTRLLRHPPGRPTQPPATTSAHSKPSATTSPSNPPPDRHDPSTGPGSAGS